MKKTTKVVSLVIMLILIISMFSGCTVLQKPNSFSKIDTSNMKLIFKDDFNTLNTTKWNLEKGCVRRGGYWDDSQINVRDGNMIITTEYKNGEFGEGWYTGSATTEGIFEPTKGYAECRCILPKGSGQWGAFWLQSPNMDEGKNGTEIDVIEGPYYNDPYNPAKFKNTAFHTIHYGGYGENSKSKMSPFYSVDKDIYNEFNTYGVLWDETGYTFYVNGKKTWKTKFCPTTEPEYLWLSVEISGEDANPANPNNKFAWSGEIEKNEGGKNFKSEFIIDYVRCYEIN